MPHLTFIQHDGMTNSKSQKKVLNYKKYYSCDDCKKSVHWSLWDFIGHYKIPQCLLCAWKNRGPNTAGRYFYEYKLSNGENFTKSCPRNLRNYGT